jgi:branched-subunit amino acid transport protein
MDLALLILGMALVTFVARFSMIAILGRWNVPPDVTRALPFVPIAAFAALVAPELFLRAGEWAVPSPRFVAGIAAMLAAFLSRNVLLTLVTGMGVMWIAQAVVGK